VHRGKLLHRFQLDDESIIYDQIGPETLVQPESGEFDRHRLLAHN
jgi:hypothetical protein